MPALTPELARANQAKSAAAKRLIAETALIPSTHASHTVQYAEFTKTLTSHVQASLLMLSLRLCPLPKHSPAIDLLTKSFERMFNVWAHLTLTPNIAPIRVDKLKGLAKTIGPRAALEKIASDPAIIGLAPGTRMPIPEHLPIDDDATPDEPTDEPAPTESETKESLLPPGQTVGAPGEGGGD